MSINHYVILHARYLYFFAALVINSSAIAQIPSVSSGTIQHFKKFNSKFVPARNIDVWLPDSYDAQKKYAVLYMQDGKALFDSSIIWTKREWGVDETIGKLIAEKKINDCIVIGIWNADAKRHSEYLPQKPFESLPEAEQNSLYKATVNGNHLIFAEKIQSDNYLKFLVYELKPFIDKNFSTLTGTKNTFVAGSSMGAMIAIYAICEYPGIFGGAACLSTHWTGIFTAKNNPIPNAMIDYLNDHLPSANDHKIYFDYGSKTLDSLYKRFQLQVDAVMITKGYTCKNWISKEFIGADHSERSWKKRLAVPVSFLLGIEK